jgi:hypothetical protein
VTYAQLSLVVHVGAVIVWIGPSIAGGMFLFRAPPPSDATGLWIRRRFQWVLVVEHAAFVVLVAGGFARLHALGFDWASTVGDEGVFWLKTKLFFVALFIPMEVYDAWAAHWRIRRAFHAYDRDPKTFPELERLLLSYDRFMRAMTFFLAPALPVVVGLALAKPQ